jgi:hypothetical protein
MTVQLVMSMDIEILEYNLTTAGWIKHGHRLLCFAPYSSSHASFNIAFVINFSGHGKRMPSSGVFLQKPHGVTSQKAAFFMQAYCQ